MKINTKIASSIGTASIILTFMGIFGKGLGFFREIIYANNFGLSPEFDLYLTSAVIPVVLNTAVIYLTQHFFIPAYNRIKTESEEISIDFFSYTFWWFIFGGIIVSFLLFICSEGIINFYLSSIPYNLQQKGIKIFLLFLITVPINAGMSVITSYLQANFKFIYPALAQMLLNIIVIAMIIFFTEIFQIFILPISFVIAYIIAFTLLFIPVKSKLKFVSKHVLKLNYKLSDINILISLIFIEGLSLSYVIIDRFFIGKLPKGGIAALNYALVIYALPVTIFSIPLITTMFSKFSSSKRSPEILKKDFKNASGINVFILMPIAFLLFFYGDLFLQLFYERGKFTPADTLLTHTALQYYSLSLVFYSMYLIVVKLLYSINKYKIVLIISIIAFLLKILFNFLLVNILNQNGLALATSFIYTFLFLSGFYLVIKEISLKEKYFYLVEVFYFMVNGIISYLIVFITFYFINTNSIISELLPPVVFLSVYILNSFLLKDTSPEKVKNTIINLFG